MFHDTSWHDAKRRASVHLDARDLCGADVPREVQGSGVSALNLHVFWGENNIGRNTRDVQTVRLVNSRTNGELSDEDLASASASLRASLVDSDSLRSS